MRLHILIHALSATFLLQGCMIFSDNYQNNSYAGFAIRPLGTTIGEKQTRTLSEYVGMCDVATGEATNGRPKDKAQKSLNNPQSKFSSTTPNKTCLGNAMSAALEDSDFLCMSHLKSIYGNDAAFNIATGTLATFTSGWAAVTNGGSAKLLSAVSAFSNAERSLVNETIYKNQVTAFIGIKIAQAREDKGAAIRASLGNDRYNLAQATFDLAAYHNSCSFHYGLEKVLQEGTNSNPTAKLAQLELEQDSLLRQIQLHIQTTGLSITDDNATSKDVIYLNLRNRLARIEARINVLQDGGVLIDKSGNGSARESSKFDGTNGASNQTISRDDVAADDKPEVAGGAVADSANKKSVSAPPSTADESR